MVKQARKAFTLVEILIVVIILGILAAIVVPQFTSASEDAQISNVESQLQTIRNQIELYRVRNNGQYPAFNLGAGAANPFGDENGATAVLRGLRGDDYLRSDPVNPRTGVSDILAGAVCAAGDTNGWWWDAATGTIRAARFDEADEFGTTGDGFTSAWMD